MRRVVVSTFLSLDGVMQGPGGPDEDRSGGFDQGGWLVPYADEDMGRFMVDWMAKAGSFLLGGRPTRSSRRTGRTSPTPTT